MTSLLIGLLLTTGAQAPADVLANVRQAVFGSAQPAHRWHETVLTGQAYFSGTDCGYTLQFTPKGPFNQTIKGGLGQVSGFDGKTWWEVDRTGATRTLSFDDVDRSQALMLLLTDRWLDESAHVNATPGVHKPGDKTYTIRFKPRDNEVYEYVEIDPATWLPVSADFEVAGSKTTIALSDWRSAGSEKLPFSSRVTNEGVTDSFTVDSARQAADSDGGQYAMPKSELTDFGYDSSIPAAIETKRAPSGHVLVHPRVNGKDVGWFILDSGADAMIIDGSTADSLNLPKVGKEAVMGVGGSVQEPFRIAGDFTLGPATMHKVTFVEIDLHEISDFFKVKLSGIVGYDFFRRFIVQLDLKKPSVEIHNPTDYRLPGGNWSKLLFSSGNPAVEATFEGNHKGWFRLDSGANGSVTFHSPTVKKLHLLDGRNTDAAGLGGVGGTTEARSGEVQWFEFAGKRFDKVPATFSLATTGAFADEYLDGNIGQDLMQPFKVVFDFGGSRVAFLPSSP